MSPTLRIKNLTVFSDAKLNFAAGLNVIVGENGSGKSHLLKLVYTVLHTSFTRPKIEASKNPTKSYFQSAIAEKLIGVFKPDELGGLVRRPPGRGRCEISYDFDTKQPLKFSFNSASKSEVVVDSFPNKWLAQSTVFLPTRELLTIYPGFVSLYETTHLPFEETYRDTCVLLGAPLAKGPREKTIKMLLDPLEVAMGGKVVTDTAGRFYLKTESGNLEMHLVAEGLRKLAMLARLIATGQLLDNGYLIWDEPEANLNPKIIKLVARTILHLCQHGVRVFIATHSLFLMRELDIALQLPEFEATKRQFFGLHLTENQVEVKQGASIDDIGEITSLQEELTQADRYLSSETA